MSLVSKFQDAVKRVAEQITQQEQAPFVQPPSSPVSNPDVSEVQQQYDPAYNQTEAQVIGPDMNPIQADVAYGLIQPPQISGVGPMFEDAIGNQAMNNFNSTSGLGGQTTTSNFSFMQRITNLLQAAKTNLKDNGMFYTPPSAVAQPEDSEEG